jgi:hypothetical protein
MDGMTTSPQFRESPETAKRHVWRALGFIAGSGSFAFLSGRWACAGAAQTTATNSAPARYFEIIAA